MKRRYSFIFALAIILTVSLLSMSCGEDGGPGAPGVRGLGEEEVTGDGVVIPADSGGTIAYGNELTFIVPPGSLPEDTTIGVEKMAELPEGESDDLTGFGQGYRFTPAGTEFSLSDPAILKMKYDRASLAAKGLDPRTLQVYYFDEGLDRYVNVAGQVDTDEATITAQVEHFTVYVPMAKTLVPGNNAPFAALQNPVPNPIRAGAPIYVRATARDFDMGGAVAGVWLHYRKLQPTPAPWSQSVMTHEIRPNVLDTFTGPIPASYLTAADLGPGDDIEYYVEVTDNLGAITTTTVRSFDVTRTYNPGSLTITPANLTIASGFERLLTVRGVDNLGGNFNVVPESRNANELLGSFSRPMANGILFEAAWARSGVFEVRFGVETATSNISVMNGRLDRIDILDENGLPANGTLQVTEGHYYQFDAIGYDAFGNGILIVPQWSVFGGGSIDDDGLYYALDGNGFPTMRAIMGSVAVNQWLHIQPRDWSHDWATLNVNHANSSHNPAIASDGVTQYIVWQEAGGNDQIYVKRSDGTSWVQMGGSLNQNGGHSASMPEIAVVAGTPYVIWVEHDGNAQQVRVRHWNGSAWVAGSGPLNITDGLNGIRPGIVDVGGVAHVAWSEWSGANYRIYSKHWDGTKWVQDGGIINFDSSRDASELDMASDGTRPYIVWHEHNGSIYQIRAKYWDGTAWVSLGGPLNVDPTFDARDPAIVFDGTTPVVTWREFNGPNYQVFAARWDGSAWVQMGGSLNIDSAESASEPEIAIYGSTPYVVWQETLAGDFQVYMKHWDGTSWQQNGVAGNIYPRNAVSTAIAMRGADPIVTWQGHNGTATVIIARPYDKQ